MEDGEWDLLPRPYMESFLRAYAEAVGMNVPKVMQEFRDMTAGERRAAQGRERAPLERPEEPAAGAPPPRRRRGLVWGVVGALAALLLAAAVIAYFAWKPDLETLPVHQVQGGRPTPVDTLRQGLVDSLAAPGDTLRPDTTRRDTAITDTGAVLQVIPDSLAARLATPLGMNLVARASAPCWVRVTIDNKEIQEVLLAAGDTIAWRAKDEVNMVIGNAGGVHLEMDGEDLGILGPEGRAVTVTITPDGIQSQKMGKEKLAPPKGQGPPPDTAKANQASNT
jgi:cytoskeletal protein RodZ